jgi:hypothetical protein
MQPSSSPGIELVIRRQEQLMTKDLAGIPPIRQKSLSATIERLKGAGRSRRGAGTIADRDGAPAPGLDPVMIATLAIDHVGPATVRAVASGIEVRVTAPDEATAAVFRTALANTARRRSTDRLVRIIVD